jgi:hypothetical protein
MSTQNTHAPRRNGRVVEVPGDGSCLFHSVFIAYRSLQSGHPTINDERLLVRASLKLRHAAVDYILEHYRKPLGGIKGNLTGRDLVLLEYGSDAVDGEESVKGPLTYARKMRDGNTFGGNTELCALSAILKVAVVVEQAAGKPHVIDTLAGPQMDSGSLRAGVPILRLLLVSQHYRPILST